MVLGTSEVISYEFKSRLQQGRRENGKETKSKRAGEKGAQRLCQGRKCQEGEKTRRHHPGRAAESAEGGPGVPQGGAVEVVREAM